MRRAAARHKHDTEHVPLSDAQDVGWKEFLSYDNARGLILVERIGAVGHSFEQAQGEILDIVRFFAYVLDRKSTRLNSSH